MQNSEPAYVHCPTCRPADLPTWTLFPRSSKILSHLSLRIQVLLMKNAIAHRNTKKNGIKFSQLTQALTLGFKSQHNINIIKISSLFNHSTPKSCPFSFCLDFSYPLNSWSLDTPALPASNLDVVLEGARI